MCAILYNHVTGKVNEKKTNEWTGTWMYNELFKKKKPENTDWLSNKNTCSHTKKKVSWFIPSTVIVKFGIQKVNIQRH